MTWALVVMHFAFTGFETKEDCLAAMREIRGPGYTPLAYCIPHPQGKPVVGEGR